MAGHQAAFMYPLILRKMIKIDTEYISFYVRPKCASGTPVCQAWSITRKGGGVRSDARIALISITVRNARAPLISLKIARMGKTKSYVTKVFITIMTSFPGV